VPEEEQPRITNDDREIARTALVERMKRKHPKRPAPRWFDRADVELAAMCGAAIDGDRAEKLQAHRDAIVGAFAASKEGPPTPRFIWGALEHFFEHVERGRRRRLSDEREARWRADVSAPAPVARTVRAPVAPVPTELMSGLEQLYGPGWRSNAQ
jgi:hypothetical protein